VGIRTHALHELTILDGLHGLTDSIRHLQSLLLHGFSRGSKLRVLLDVRQYLSDGECLSIARFFRKISVTHSGPQIQVLGLLDRRCICQFVNISLQLFYVLCQLSVLLEL
jgi:hypothetical protein